MSIKSWIEAMRLRTLPLAVAHISMGNVLAASIGSFRWPICILSILTAVSLQILSNLANDYGDAANGADHEGRQGPDRAVSSGTITRDSMKRAMYIAAFISLVLGLVLIKVALSSVWWITGFLLLGMAAIWAAINYTAGSRPYGYRGLGDISVFIFFGLLAVLGSFFLQTRSFDWYMVLPAASCGLFSIGVLNVNNIRDIESDRTAGKFSIPVKIGRKNAVKYHIFLLTAGVICSVIFTLLRLETYGQFLFLIIIPLLLINIRAVATIHDPMRLDPYLKQLALTNVIFVMTFAVGILAFAA